MFQMALFKTFSYNVEVQYKSTLLSKATLFTVITTTLTFILPFIVAYRSRGFWLKSSYFYEQPLVHSTYEYLLIAETDDPSVSIICGDTAALDADKVEGEENCVEIQIQEDDINQDGKNDILRFYTNLIVPKNRIISSIILIIGIDLIINNVCPLQMQSLAVITKEFNGQPNGFKYYGDLKIRQTKHLACLRNILDTSQNSSLFNHKGYDAKNILDIILQEYLEREVTTVVTPIYSKSQNGHTDTINLSIFLRISEIKFQYTPSLLQELKWAWPQYLSLLFIVHWLFGKIRKFLFSNRLLMAWEIIPWRKRDYHAYNTWDFALYLKRALHVIIIYPYNASIGELNTFPNRDIDRFAGHINTMLCLLCCCVYHFVSCKQYFFSLIKKLTKN